MLAHARFLTHVLWPTTVIRSARHNGTGSRKLGGALSRFLLTRCQVYIITLQGLTSRIPGLAHTQLALSPPRVSLIAVAAALLNANRIADEAQAPERRTRSILTARYTDSHPG
ncbi:hypothetical protein MY3957_008640 [Beauveria namnaoensis]